LSENRTFERWWSDSPAASRLILAQEYMTTTAIGLALGLLTLIAASPALAKDKSTKPQKPSSEADSAKKTAEPREDSKAAKWAFTVEERRIVQAYVSEAGSKKGRQARPLPPGLSKKVARGGKLPPGWQKKCVAGKTMPAEVFEQCHPLPPELVVKLPPPPEPTLTVTIGGKLVRVLKATREILDVFDVNVRY
jgi:hypothetical protein